MANTLRLDVSSFPEVANLRSGKSVNLKLKCTCISKCLECGEEVMELSVDGISEMTMKKDSVRSMLFDIATKLDNQERNNQSTRV